MIDYVITLDLYRLLFLCCTNPHKLPHFYSRCWSRDHPSPTLYVYGKILMWKKVKQLNKQTNKKHSTYMCACRQLLSLLSFIRTHHRLIRPVLSSSPWFLLHFYSHPYCILIFSFPLLPFPLYIYALLWLLTELHGIKTKRKIYLLQWHKYSKSQTMIAYKAPLRYS